MTKANLIFVHSFPTNSKALNGLIGYLNLFFQVIPVDLPGFIKNIPAIEPASLKDYSCYVDAVVTKLKLENFYMGGGELWV